LVTHAPQVAAVFARVPTRTVNTLALAYLVTRALYNWIYINNEDETVCASFTSFRAGPISAIYAANLRSAIYVSGIGIIGTLFVKSANLLAASVI
jgi:hypothetical protein